MTRRILSTAALAAFLASGHPLIIPAPERTSERRALELMPDLTDALLNLSTTLIALGRYAEAEAGFRQALTIRP
ncbi:MAG: hypothetical protein J0M02_16760, partial [Planctomycetes bacterium]|nr:hypothetical protein [Planctomycetota bacterium]